MQISKIKASKIAFGVHLEWRQVILSVGLWQFWFEWKKEDQ